MCKSKLIERIAANGDHSYDSDSLWLLSTLESRMGKGNSNLRVLKRVESNHAADLLNWLDKDDSKELT